MGVGSSKLAGSPLGRQAVKTGLKHFKKKADEIRAMAQESGNQTQQAAIQKALESNKNDKEAFKELVRDVTGTSTANRDLADLYKPLGESRADTIASQERNKTPSK